MQNTIILIVCPVDASVNNWPGSYFALFLAYSSGKNLFTHGGESFDLIALNKALSFYEACTLYMSRQFQSSDWEDQFNWSVWNCSFHVVPSLQGDDNEI